MIPSIDERRSARLNLASRTFRARLDRTRFFHSSLFSDAAWDILLGLYVFRAAGKNLGASDLCRITCETSLTTSLRLQRRLVDLGLIRRTEDPCDGRRLIVELTDEGITKLEDYLDHEMLATTV